MRNRIIVLLLALQVAMLPRQGHGQGATPLVSITQLAGFQVCPDTVFHQQLVTMQVTFHNVGNTAMQVGDTLIVAWKNTDSVAVSVYQEDIASFGLTSNFNPNDTVSFVTTYTYDSTRYKTGSNIVVVWPRSSNSTTIAADYDTLTVCFNPILTLVAPVGPHNQSFTLSPNPFSDGFEVLTESPELIERVRIFNVLGELCLSRPYKGRMQAGVLSPGIYIVEVRLRGREAVYRRVLKR